MYYNTILSLYHSEIIYWFCLLLQIIGLQNGRFVQYTGLDSLETQIDTTGLPHPYLWGKLASNDHTTLESFLWHHTKLFDIVWTAMARGGTSHSHMSNIMLVQLAKTVSYCPHS